jgi:NADPH2:quinone reductase
VLFRCAADPAELPAVSRNVFDLVGCGVPEVPMNRRYRLGDAAQAHRELEARRTTGR